MLLYDWLLWPDSHIMILKLLCVKGKQLVYIYYEIANISSLKDLFRGNVFWFVLESVSTGYLGGVDTSTTQCTN